MNKIFAIFLIISGFAAPAFAAHGGKHVFITANGLVCDICAQSLKKVFMKNNAIAGVDINLTTKIVTVDLKEDASLTDDDINKAFYYAGYDIVGIKRD